MASNPGQDVDLFAGVLRVYRMRAFDLTLGRLVYWFAATPDVLSVEYEGPGPLDNIVISNVVGR